MWTPDERAIGRAAERQWGRTHAGRAALRALDPDLDGVSSVEDAVYVLAREVLALRERVAALEAKAGANGER